MSPAGDSRGSLLQVLSLSTSFLVLELIENVSLLWVSLLSPGAQAEFSTLSPAASLHQLLPLPPPHPPAPSQSHHL